MATATVKRARLCAWASLVLASPEMLAILALLLQHVHHFDLVADLATSVVGNVFFLTTTILAGVATIVALPALLHRRLLQARHEVAAWASFLIGSGYFAVLMSMKLFTKELQPF